MASLRLLSPSAVSDGCHLFYIKNWWPFLVFVLKSGDLFSSNCHHPLLPFQVIVCPLFLWFSHKKIFRLSLGFHPPGLSPGAVRLPPPSPSSQWRYWLWAYPRFEMWGRVHRPKRRGTWEEGNIIPFSRKFLIFVDEMTHSPVHFTRRFGPKTPYVTQFEPQKNNCGKRAYTKQTSFLRNLAVITWTRST